MSDHAFILPNGKNLSYAWPHQAKGGQFRWTQSYLTDKLQNHKAKKKERQIRVGLWTSRSNMHIVCADFDNLPMGFDDWECFFEYARATWGKEGYVYRSYHQKVKVLFLGETDRTVYMNKQFALSFLKEKIGFEFYEYLDLSSTAMSTSFINGYQVEKIRNWMSKAKCHVIDTTEEIHNYKESTDAIPKELLPFIKNAPESQKQPREKFLRILLRMFNLNLNGFDLPTTKLGRECGVAAARISEWKTELIEMKALHLVDDTYCKGFKSKTYKAHGALRKAIYRVMETTKKTLALITPTLPGSIADGMWEATLWEYSKYFVTRPEAFLHWALNLPGARAKNRFKKAFRSLNSRLKYARLKPLPIPRRI